MAYASRALTATESRYAQIEKELLAIVYSLEKFHQYTFGRHTHIQSDHKPLEAIFRKSLSAMPRRLQGMMLRIQGYDVTVTYTKGTNIPLADTLSRAYLNNKTPNPQADLEYINQVEFLMIHESRLSKLREAT